jgi:hypothetical protein
MHWCEWTFAIFSSLAFVNSIIFPFLDETQSESFTFSQPLSKSIRPNFPHQTLSQRKIIMEIFFRDFKSDFISPSHVG